MSKKPQGPRVLLFDIETAPVKAFVWKLFDENIGLNQVQMDWHILSVSAKWLGDAPSKTLYKDQSRVKDIENDRKLLKWIWKLLDKADIVITQNGRRFDQKKLFARFVLNGMQPPSTFKHIDTFQLAKKHFAFTSNRLEYLSEKLAPNYKKLVTRKFAGFDLWRECLARNPEAWKEMERYNRQDVLALEEVYLKLVPWDDQINFSVYYDDEGHVCKCGSREFKKQGWHYTSAGKYQRYRCKKCGAETRDKKNVFSLEKKASLHMGTPR